FPEEAGAVAPRGTRAARVTVGRALERSPLHAHAKLREIELGDPVERAHRPRARHAEERLQHGAEVPVDTARGPVSLCRLGSARDGAPVPELRVDRAKEDI